MNYIGNKERLRRANQKIVHLKRELKKAEKVIDEMAEYFGYGLAMCDDCKDSCSEKCSACIKEYFYKKAKEMDE